MSEIQTTDEKPLAVNFARASALTSLSKVTLRRFAKTGQIRVVRVGRRVLIPIAALESLINSGIEAKKVAV